MRGWKPIETAPKDGRPVLLWWPYWHPHQPVIGHWRHSQWNSELALTNCGPGPLYWMSLPTPPDPEGK